MNFPRSSMTPVNCPLSCRSFTRSTASYRECKVPKCKIKLTVEFLLWIKFFFLNQINQYQSSKFLFPSHLQLSYNELSVYKSCWHCWFVSDFGGEEEGRGTIWGRRWGQRHRIFIPIHQWFYMYMYVHIGISKWYKWIISQYFSIESPLP